MALVGLMGEERLGWEAWSSAVQGLPGGRFGGLGFPKP